MLWHLNLIVGRLIINIGKKFLKSNITIENLINDLRKCENPFNCPHGRPTTVYYSSSDLEKLFKRSGFKKKI